MDHQLKQFVEDLGLDNHLRVESELGDGFVRLCVAEAERRQARHDIRSSEDILIELLRNSRDAQARHIFIATYRQEDKRHFVIIDDGCGVPERLQNQIFEARVTSKLESIHEDTWGVHGRGMALYSIKSNCLEAFICKSEPGAGCALKVVSSVNQVRERTEQSALPNLTRLANKSLKITGPKNINRLVVEFALTEQDRLVLYLGSPVEIAATLRGHLMSAQATGNQPKEQDSEAPSSLNKYAQGDSISSYKPHIASSLACAQDDESFVQAAQELGLSMSCRSAHRIRKGEIQALDPFIATIPIAEESPPKPSRAELKLDSQPKNARVTDQDLETIQATLDKLYSELSASYYLDPNLHPEIKQKRGELVISIPLQLDS